MRALRRLCSSTAWVHDAPEPTLERPDDVIVRVLCAGICRTDLYAARGLIATPTPLTLGHEFCGVVTGTAPAVTRVREGDYVSAHPLLPCGACDPCARGLDCARPRMIGVHLDGAFAEFVRLPATALYRLPSALPPRRAAYLEPVAASLAVTRAGLDRPEMQRGALIGDGRIASLTLRVLSATGRPDVEHIGCDALHTLCPDAYDFMIETRATEATLAAAMRALRPGGTLVLKSRPAERVPFDVHEAVRRRLTIQAVDYGSYDQAIALLSGDALSLDDLLGPMHHPRDHEALFDALLEEEHHKHFFDLEDLDD